MARSIDYEQLFRVCFVVIELVVLSSTFICLSNLEFQTQLKDCRNKLFLHVYDNNTKTGVEGSHTLCLGR